MGWLWASTTPTAAPQPQGPTKVDALQSSAAQEPVDAEVQKFLDLFKTDAERAPDSEPPSSSSSSFPTSAPSRPASSAASWLSLKASSQSGPATPPAPPRDALAESLLPTEMSCRHAFDLAWACNSLGGQLNSIYRYGTMRSCSEQWNDFWFCMRTKSYTGEVKENMVRQHYRDKEHAKYGYPKPSSEDIWDSRLERLPPGTAFSEPIEEPDAADDEWHKRETQRRIEIRQALGYEKAAADKS